MFRENPRMRAVEDQLRALDDQLRQTRDIAIEARTEGRSHYATCVEHNRRVEELLTEGRTFRDVQHHENQTAIEGIHARISSLSTRLDARINTLIFTILGAMGIIVASLIGALYTIYAHRIGL